MVDAEPDEHAPQRPLLRPLDRVDEQLRRALADPLERHELVDGERVDVGRVLEQPGVDELAHALLAEPFDVERAAARPVHEPLHALRGTVDIDAVVVGLALEAHERLAARRALRSGTSSGRVRGGRLASTGPTTSGMTSPARRTITVSPGRTSLRATSSSLCSVAIPTLAPPTNTGSSTANGVAPAGAADAHHDVVEDRGLLLGRELVRDRPARRPRREAHLGALAEVVDLHDDTVDLVAERVAVRFHLLAEREDRVEIVERLDLRVHREAELRTHEETLAWLRELGFPGNPQIEAFDDLDGGVRVLRAAWRRNATRSATRSTVSS